MAVSNTKLSLTFNRADAASKTMTIGFSYAKSAANLTQSDVNTLVQAIITNGSVFKKTPGSIKKAELIVTDKTDFTPNS